jgi:hypothetical protein
VAEPIDGEIEFTPQWWRDKLPRDGKYQVWFAVDGEPGPPEGWPKRSRSWVGETAALWGQPATVRVAAGSHTVHAWMTIYVSDGQGGTNVVDFEYRCKLDVEVAAGLVRRVTYAIARRRGPLFLPRLSAHLSAD